jgi:hypothetical protein
MPLDAMSLASNMGNLPEVNTNLLLHNHIVAIHILLLLIFIDDISPALKERSLRSRSSCLRVPNNSTHFSPAM